MIPAGERRLQERLRLQGGPSVEDYLKALQGYGGIDYGGAMQANKKFDLPGRWVDGDYNPEHDLLKGVICSEAARAINTKCAAASTNPGLRAVP